MLIVAGGYHIGECKVHISIVVEGSVGHCCDIVVIEIYCWSYLANPCIYVCLCIYNHAKIVLVKKKTNKIVLVS